MSKTMREKMSQRSMGNKNMLGKRHTPEARLKMSIARKGKVTGIAHPKWKGGVSITQTKNNVIRKERMLLAGGNHTQGEWELLKKQYNHKCPACGDTKNPLTKDHIIPVSKGGSDNIENIQPLCKRCNSKKHTLIIKYKHGS
jgi:hypothetical protein